MAAPPAESAVLAVPQARSPACPPPAGLTAGLWASLVPWPRCALGASRRAAQGPMGSRGAAVRPGRRHRLLRRAALRWGYTYYEGRDNAGHSGAFLVVRT